MIAPWWNLFFAIWIVGLFMLPALIGWWALPALFVLLVFAAISDEILPPI